MTWLIALAIVILAMAINDAATKLSDAIQNQKSVIITVSEKEK